MGGTARRDAVVARFEQLAERGAALDEEDFFTTLLHEIDATLAAMDEATSE